MLHLLCSCCIHHTHGQCIFINDGSSGVEFPSATMSLSRFKLVFFCPSGSTQKVLQHLFDKFPKELGNIGEYDQFAFISSGVGKVKERWPLSQK